MTCNLNMYMTTTKSKTSDFNCYLGPVSNGWMVAGTKLTPEQISKTYNELK